MLIKVIYHPQRCPLMASHFAKQREILFSMSRKDRRYLEKHIRLLPSVKELQQVIIMSTIYLFVDTEVRSCSLDSGGFVSD